MMFVQVLLLIHAVLVEKNKLYLQSPIFQREIVRDDLDVRIHVLEAPYLRRQSSPAKVSSLGSNFDRYQLVI